MAKFNNEIDVKFTSNTKGYVDGVKEATQATEGLNDEIVDVDGGTTVLTDSANALSSSLTQTSEGLIDSTTGMSGLGAAASKTAKSVIEATKKMSLFNQSLVAVGGATVAIALAAVVIFWDDIKAAIDKGTDAAIAFRVEQEKNALAATQDLENQLAIRKKLDPEGEFTQLLEKEILLNKLVKATTDVTEAEEFLGAVLLSNIGTLEKANADIITIYGGSLETLKVKVDEATKAWIDFNEVATIEIDTTEADQALALSNALFNIRKQNRDNNNEEEIKANEETQEKLTTDLKRHQDIRAKDADRAAKLRIQTEQHIADSFTSIAFSMSSIIKTISRDNQAFVGGVMIAEAIAAGALGIMAIVSDLTIPLPAKPVMFAAVAATTSAQIGIIASNMGASGKAVSAPSVLPTAATTNETATTETFSINQQQTPQAQVVLVTSDLDAVQETVRVTADRSTLGGKA